MIIYNYYIINDINRATQSSIKTITDESVANITPIKVQDVKLARTLASDITNSGAKLYDLLANELTDRYYINIIKFYIIYIINLITIFFFFFLLIIYVSI